jgi:hypothetical protein
MCPGAQTMLNKHFANVFDEIGRPVTNIRFDEIAC